MAFTLPPLPYEPVALEPHISARTFEFHHGKHHAAYVNNLNNLVSSTELAERSLEAIIKAVAGDAGKLGVFNNAAQVWNHTFFWSSMRPVGGGAPTGELAQRIDADFGGLDGFKAAFKDAAVKQFGSGWAWLVLEAGKLKVVSTANADTPMEFFIAGPVFAMLPMAMMPIVLGVLARIDQSGRLTGSHPAFVLIGGAVAPFVGGAISDLGGFQVNGWFAVGCIVLGAALLVDAIRRSDRMR